ncbi:heme peroxidase [Clohesyomyces aquaticus]|uniref:Heme peroxidase n=1 Tax=Clohesyomyces aquaticus TaxID=1231657 RepID=A0A1Y1ZSN7_9PLEO|nr:heme peroxidase [Clohesyomyces aquaticus]
MTPLAPYWWYAGTICALSPPSHVFGPLWRLTSGIRGPSVCSAAVIPASLAPYQWYAKLGSPASVRRTAAAVSSAQGLFKGSAEAAADGGLVEDRDYVMKKLVAALASLSLESMVAELGTGTMLKTLWDNLKHPPISYMGNPFKYWAADGSNSNVMLPHIEKSGSFYARSVTPRHIPTVAPPDSGLLFDTLPARKSPPKEHPSKISSMPFALARIIIYDLFRTNDFEQNLVDVSSYLDLSPLYGSNKDIQDMVRAFKDGKLKLDTFAEVRLLGQPPESAALLICFNRYHNYTADPLAITNEAQRFSCPDDISMASTEVYVAAVAKRDNDVFQTARLATCALHMNITTNDYFRTILNTHRTDSNWTLNPRRDYSEIFGSGNLEKGIGNQVSAEFNLIYRWYSTISARNEHWLDAFFERLFPGPNQRTFSHLKRNDDGGFDHNVAGSFGARNVSLALKAVEIMGIWQGRKWVLVTLNELREYFGMLPYKAIFKINSDPDVAAALEALCRNLENVEIYPAVVVEEAKEPMIPASGLCAGFTTTRAILSDAMALVCGDRFYTFDYNPANLTAFGFREVANDVGIAGGGPMYNLLMRAFRKLASRVTTGETPIYAYYPFTVPSENRLIQRALEHKQDFTYDSPQRVARSIIGTSWKGVHAVLSDSKDFRVPWVHAGGDEESDAKQRRLVGQSIYGPEHSIYDFRYFFENCTTNLIRGRSRKLRDICEIEVVRDVASLSCAAFVVNLLYILIKSYDSDAVFDARNLYDMLCAIFAYIFLHHDPVDSMSLQMNAKKAYQELTGVMKPVCQAQYGQGFTSLLQQFYAKVGPKASLRTHGAKLLRHLFEARKGVDEVVSIVISTACAAVVPSALALPQALDLFLQEQHSSHWSEIHELSRDVSSQAFEKLRKYALESSPSHQPHVRSGDTILLSLSSASVDPENFPAPDEIRLDRSEDAYMHLGYRPHACLGRHIAFVALASQLRVFGRLKGLKRSPRPQEQRVGRNYESPI